MLRVCESESIVAVVVGGVLLLEAAHMPSNGARHRDSEVAGP